MNGFKNYLKTLGTLSEQSINDDMSRINIMKNRHIDYTRDEEYTKAKLEMTNLSESTIKSCLRLCRRYQEYKEILNKEIVSSIIKAYEDVQSKCTIAYEDIELENNKQEHEYRSSKFISNTTNRIKKVLKDDDIYVFSRKEEKYKDFNLSEYLFDIHACRIKKLKSVNGHDVEYVEKSLVQIESELSNNSKHVSADFSKLVCGNADLKIMIIRRAFNEERFRNSFLDIARNISEKLYLIQIEHPENWEKSNIPKHKVFVYNGNWEYVEL